MKLNLESSNYDINNWKLTKKRNDEYYLTNLSTKIPYNIGQNVMGIYQVSNNEFLIHRGIRQYTQRISKLLLLPSGRISIVFSEDCEYFYILSDTTILFDNRMVYDIKENKLVKSFDWLSGKRFSIIEPPNNYPHPVLCLKIPTSFLVHNQEFILAFVDAVTFKIIKNEVISTLRGNKPISLGNGLSIQDVVAEDKEYISIIENSLFRNYDEIQKMFKNFAEHIFS